MSTATEYCCPRCLGPANQHGSPPPRLYAGQAAGMTLLACGACGGVFLTTKCAQKLASCMPQEALVLAGRIGDGATYFPDHSGALSCPMCQQPMRRTRLADQDLEIDSCGAHGNFYDRGEIQRLAAGLRKAGWGTYGAAATAGSVAAVAALSAPQAAVVSQITAQDAVVGVDQAGTAFEVADVAVSVVGFIFEALISAAD